MKRIRFTLTALLSFVISSLCAQDDLLKMLEEESETGKPQEVIATFKTTRIINAQSIETVKGKGLDFRVTHRFGDIGGDAGGVHTLYGVDGASDIRISFEYGVTDKLTLGVGRSKGAKIKEIFDGYIKYKVLAQTTDNSMPFTLTLFSNAALSGMKETSAFPEADFGGKFEHRLSYTTQALIARKFNDRLSLQLMPTYIHRNFVASEDKNGMFAMGVGGRLKFTQRFGIIADYYYLPTLNSSTGETNYYNPLSVGIEIETGGHVFHLNFTNSKGIIENEYIPYTSSSWLKGQYRFGFNISRIFNI